MKFEMAEIKVEKFEVMDVITASQQETLPPNTTDLF